MWFSRPCGPVYDILVLITSVEVLNESVHMHNFRLQFYANLLEDLQVLYLWHGDVHMLWNFVTLM